MKKTSFLFIVLILLSTLFLACEKNTSDAKKTEVNATQYIQHTVMFNLRHENNSSEEKQFLEDGLKILSAIPVVKNFEVKRQMSPKNEFKFYFTMYFANKEDYESYNTCPEHVKFVAERWETEVVKFLEADFVAYP